MVRSLLLFLPLLVFQARFGAPPQEDAQPVGADARTSVPSNADPFEAPELAPATLTAMRGDPSAWLGRRARVVLQLRGEAPRWNPWLTRFGPSDWSRYEAWGDEQFLWEKAAFDDPAPWVFAARDEVPDRLLRGARPHTRFEAIVVVRETFLGEPWIEVERVRRLPETVEEGTLLHAVRALELHRAGTCERAGEQFARAATAGLPAHAREELDRLEAECRAQTARGR